MTDREFLEAAAKAAGIHVVGLVEKFIAQPRPEHEGGFIVRNDRGGDSAWNPLTDDGDALRLAVELRMTVAIYTRRAEARVHAESGRVLAAESEPIERAPDEATRRAIVRAAAALGQPKGAR